MRGFEDGIARVAVRYQFGGAGDLFDAVGWWSHGGRGRLGESVVSFDLTFLVGRDIPAEVEAVVMSREEAEVCTWDGEAVVAEAV